MIFLFIWVFVNDKNLIPSRKYWGFGPVIWPWIKTKLQSSIPGATSYKRTLNNINRIKPGPPLIDVGPGSNLVAIPLLNLHRLINNFEWNNLWMVTRIFVLINHRNINHTILYDRSILRTILSLNDWSKNNYSLKTIQRLWVILRLVYFHEFQVCNLRIKTVLGKNETENKNNWFDKIIRKVKI